MPPIRIEGFTPEQLLAEADLAQLVFSGEPLVFNIGTAEVLASFRTEGTSVIAELAHVDGGGEGVLPLVVATLIRLARSHGMVTIQWQVHATRCATPNTRLRALLEKTGFAVQDVPGKGELYCRTDHI